MATYTVKTIYKVVTDGAKQSVDKLAASMDRLNAGVNRVQSVLSTLGVVAGAAFAGALASVYKLVSQTTELGGAAENARLAMAGMIQASRVTGEGPEGLNRALELSDALIRQMRRDAADLPGTFEDLQSVMQGALSGGLNAGKSIGEIERLARLAMGVGALKGIDAAQTGRDMNLMLAGRAGANVAMFSALQAQIGLSAEQFNQLSQPQRFQRILRALSAYGPAVDAYKNSWDAVSSTAKDHLTSILRVGTAPLFERMKSVLSDVNKWFERNEQLIVKFANAAGHKAVAAFDEMVAKARELHSLLQRVQGFAGSIGNRISSGVASVGGANVASTAAGVAATAATGIPGIGIVIGALASFATHTDAVALTFFRLQTIIDPLTNKVSMVFDTVTMVVGGLGNMLAAILPGLAGGLSAVFVAVTGGLGERLSMIGGTFQQLFTILQPLFAVIGPLLQSLGKLFGKIVGLFLDLANAKLRAILSIFSTLVAVLTPVVAWAGDHLRRIIDWLSNRLDDLSRVVHRVREAIETVIGSFRSVITSLINWMRSLPGIGRFVAGFPEPTQTAPEAAAVPEAPRFAGDPWAVSSSYSPFKLNNAFRRNDRTLLDTARANQGSPNITQHNNITIQNTINQAEDPDRILMVSRSAWLEALRGPIESAQSAVTR